MAGNDTEGLRYATIETPEKYYLRWVEETGPHAEDPNLLDSHLLQICGKVRFLELIHNFVAFDAGIKKLCRQNQYFGVKAAQEFVRRREGGIIWHTQGSGKAYGRASRYGLQYRSAAWGQHWGQLCCPQCCPGAFWDVNGCCQPIRDPKPTKKPALARASGCCWICSDV